MSIRQVQNTIEQLLKDPSLGMAATMERIATVVLTPAEADEISTDFSFGRWTTPGNTVRPATAANIMTRPRRWLPYVNNNGSRVAIAEIDIGFESFKAAPANLELELAIAATALRQVIDSLEQFSDDNEGTIVRVQDPMLFQFGFFEGPTSSGFIATVTIDEESTSE